MDTNATINLRQIIEQIHENKQTARTDITEIGLKLPGLSKAPCTFMNWSIYEHFLSMKEQFHSAMNINSIR